MVAELFLLSCGADLSIILTPFLTAELLGDAASHPVCHVLLAFCLQMTVDIRRHADVGMSYPLLYVFQGKSGVPFPCCAGSSRIGNRLGVG